MKWQPIETAPKDGIAILVCLPNMQIEIGRWCPPDPYMKTPCAGHWAYRRSIQKRCQFEHQPTHWMPLPDPPRGI
jgi:hypothetical protein